MTKAKTRLAELKESQQVNKLFEAFEEKRNQPSINELLSKGVEKDFAQYLTQVLYKQGASVLVSEDGETQVYFLASSIDEVFTHRLEEVRKANPELNRKLDFNRIEVGGLFLGEMNGIVEKFEDSSYLILFDIDFWRLLHEVSRILVGGVRPRPANDKKHVYVTWNSAEGGHGLSIWDAYDLISDYASWFASGGSKASYLAKKPKIISPDKVSNKIERFVLWLMQEQAATLTWGMSHFIISHELAHIISDDFTKSEDYTLPDSGGIKLSKAISRKNLELEADMSAVQMQSKIEYGYNTGRAAPFVFLKIVDLFDTLLGITYDSDSSYPTPDDRIVATREILCSFLTDDEFSFGQAIGFLFDQFRSIFTSREALKKHGYK